MHVAWEAAQQCRSCCAQAWSGPGGGAAGCAAARQGRNTSRHTRDLWLSIIVMHLFRLTPPSQGAAVEDHSGKPAPKYDEEGKFDDEPDIDISTVRLTHDSIGLPIKPTRSPHAYSNTRSVLPLLAQPLNHENFMSTLARYPIVVVNFYAP
jgi:hypothetical protein